MTGLVDFHSHVLPAMDDGSACVEESLAMLRAQAGQGIRDVVATPHFYGHRESLTRFLERRDHAEQTLRSAMSCCEGLPTLHMGAEVFYFPGISDAEGIEALTLAPGYLMVELPTNKWDRSVYRELERLVRKRRITPIVAHIDRYLRPFLPSRLPEELDQLPVLVQANAGFFLDKRMRATALRLLSEGKIQLLGSDCHNMTSRPPNLGEAVRQIEKKLGPEALDELHRWESAVLKKTGDR